MKSLGSAHEYCEEFYPCDELSHYENFYITGDYLLWKAFVGKLEYAIDGLNFPTTSGETKELDWKWDSGFKVGIGYAFSDFQSDVYLNYTRFYTKAEGTALPQPGRLLYATYANPFLFDINAASSQFELNYNTLDLEWRKTFCITPCVLLTPSFGLRGAWTKDNDKIFYDGFLTDENIRLAESFHGVGPRMGLNVTWNLWRGLYLFGEGDYALVGGKHRASFFSTSDTTIAADTHQDFYALRHLVDILFGLGWDYSFCRSVLTFQLAWEQRIWLDYNQYFRFVEGNSLDYVSNSSALNLYGLTLRAKYSF